MVMRPTNIKGRKKNPDSSWMSKQQIHPYGVGVALPDALAIIQPVSGEAYFDIRVYVV